jgi:ferredoxin
MLAGQQRHQVATRQRLKRMVAAHARNAQVQHLGRCGKAAICQVAKRG